MGRPCTVCQHPKRKAIDRALASGESYRAVAGRFGLVPTSMQRHQNAHLVAVMAKATAAAEVVDVAHGASLVSQARSGRDTALGLLASAQEILERAREEADHATALDAIRAGAVALKEARAHVELLGKATGELRSGTTVEIHTSPPFVEARDTILGALAPHPAALAAVVSALKTTAERKRLGGGR